MIHSAGLLIGCGKKVKFRGIFRDKITENSADFAGIFGANLAGKQSVKKRWILWLFSGQILLEIDRFCIDQTSIFNVFITEVIICSFNDNTLKKWTNGKAYNIKNFTCSSDKIKTEFTSPWLSDISLSLHTDLHLFLLRSDRRERAAT